MKKVKIEIRKADGNVIKDMGGFAAYRVGSMTDKKPVVLLNVFATLQACIENDISIKQQVIESLMHEFGHVLEEFYDKEFSEDFIEGVVMSYREKYGGEQPLEENIKDLFRSPKTIRQQGIIEGAKLMWDYLEEPKKKERVAKFMKTLEE